MWSDAEIYFGDKINVSVNEGSVVKLTSPELNFFFFWDFTQSVTPGPKSWFRKLILFFFV